MIYIMPQGFRNYYVNDYTEKFMNFMMQFVKTELDTNTE